MTTSEHHHIDKERNDGRRLRATDVQCRNERIGRALELWSAGGKRLVDVFVDHDTSIRVFQAYTLEPIPIEAIERLLERARIEL